MGSLPTTWGAIFSSSMIGEPFAINEINLPSFALMCFISFSNGLPLITALSSSMILIGGKMLYLKILMFRSDVLNWYDKPSLWKFWLINSTLPWKENVSIPSGIWSMSISVLCCKRKLPTLDSLKSRINVLLQQL